MVIRRKDRREKRLEKVSEGTEKEAIVRLNEIKILSIHSVASFVSSSLFHDWFMRVFREKNLKRIEIQKR